MKSLSRLSLLCITLISVQFTFAQVPEWDSIYKTAWTGHFMNFEITKNSDVAAFANNGFLYYSADTGKSWTPVFNIFPEDRSYYTSVANQFFKFAPDSLHGISTYEYEDSYYMDITSDGGKTWKHSAYDFTGKTISGLYWKNADTAFMMAGGSIHVTNNGGDNWTEVQGGFNSKYHFCFFSESEGYAFGLGTHYKTADGGKTWQAYSDPNLYVDGIYELANGKVLLIGNDDDKAINITTDDSRFIFTKMFTYTPVTPLTLTSYNLFNVHELANGDLYVSEGGDCYYSSNGGNSWSNIGDWGNSKFVNDQIVLNIGTYLTTNISHDTGQSWQKYVYEAGEGLQSLHIKSKDEWFLISGNMTQYATCGNLLHTKDGGETWETIHFNDKLVNMQFVTNDTIYLTGYEVIYRSIDAGETWERFVTDANGGYPYFITPNIGYLGAKTIMSGGSIIYKTTDAGETWTEADGSATWDWDFIDNESNSRGAFKSITEGLMDATDGIVHTTNGGDNWDFISGVEGIPFYINDTWIVMDWRNHKIHTCDENINCTTTFTDIETYTVQYQRMLDVHKIDDNTIMVTYDGDMNFMDSVIVSRDNGQTWTKEYNPHPNSKITYFDSKTVFGLGSRFIYKGTIKVQTTGSFGLSTDNQTVNCTITTESQENFTATIKIVKNGTETITVSTNTNIVNNQEFGVTIPASITSSDNFVVIIEPNDDSYATIESESLKVPEGSAIQTINNKHNITVLENRIICDCDDFVIYNTIGQIVNKNEELQTGVYIVKCGENVEKVIVKH